MGDLTPFQTIQMKEALKAFCLGCQNEHRQKTAWAAPYLLWSIRESAIFARIAEMQSQPDWGKRGVWAAYIIGIPAFLLTVFAYLRPPDPTHPIGFDFLFRTVSIPFWLLISLLVLAIIFALAFRVLSPRLTKTQNLEPKFSELRTTGPAALQTSSKRLVHTTPNTGQVVIATADQLEIHIKAENAIVTMKVDNNRLGAIHHLDMIIYSACSFDGRHNDFRIHPAATGARMQSSSTVLPSESSQPFVLVHHPIGKDALQLGNDNAKVMKWPENDKATVQKWQLDVSFGARAYSNSIPPTGEVFKLFRFNVIVTWDATSNELSVEKT